MNKIIITTADISDFDGFLAFALYIQQSKANYVLFIMNYPAYFNNKFNDPNNYLTFDNPNMFKIANIGLGYNYNYKDFYNYHKSFFSKTNITPDNFKDEMKKLAYYMCYNIYNEIQIENKPKFIFIDGGINDFNPFSISTLKNDIQLYYDVLTTINQDIYNLIDNIPDNHTFFNSLNEFFSYYQISNYEIYIDMNGSFAFYENENKIFLDDNKDKIKILVIMGGVNDNQELKTLGKTNFLNRFSTATMNQFYSPSKFQSFLESINLKNRIFIISNNLISNHFNFNNFDSFNNYITNTINLNNFNNNISKKLFNKYYIPGKSSYKPFDLISAHILIKQLTNVNLGNKFTSFSIISCDFNYGITIIRNINNKNDLFLNFEKFLCININKIISNEITSDEITHIRNLNDNGIKPTILYNITLTDIDDNFKLILNGGYKKIKKLKKFIKNHSI